MRKHTADRRLASGWVRLSLVGVILGCLCLQGCLVFPVSIAPSTKPLTPGSYTELGETSGRAYALMVFGLPLSEPNVTGRARDRAIEAMDADALVNVAVNNYQINLIFFTVMITDVNGIAVKEN